MEYQSTAELLEGFWTTPWGELPEKQAAAWKLAEFPGIKWDDIGPERRKLLATQYDQKNDPKNEEEGEFWFNNSCDIADVKREIREIELLSAPLPSERAEKLRQLDDARKRLAELKAAQFKPLGDESPKIEQQELSGAQFAEYIVNGFLIDWDYWILKMPVLTTAQAARLMAGLDPDVFESLDNRPNSNNPEAFCSRAKKMERSAIAQQIALQSPSKWLEWAGNHSFSVHEAFRVAVSETLNTCDSEVPKSKGEAPLQRQRFQEQEIIRALNELDYNPQSIPKWKAGERGVKSAIREFLKDHKWSDKVFDKAWQRLRDSGEIAEF
ncbi:MAG: hypothetical protein D3M94_07930 [Rhodocyclales bacterium GT-UBC]|nr:MAG: hypothetical protein D3M94_07930 [Rhodocyclales bacterium GT-UBC]